MPSAAVTPSGRLTEYAVSTVEALHRELRPPDQTAVTVALTGSEKQAQLRVLAEMSSRVGQLLGLVDARGCAVPLPSPKESRATRHLERRA